jgi:hypothetical protein
MIDRKGKGKKRGVEAAAGELVQEDEAGGDGEDSLTSRLLAIVALKGLDSKVNLLCLPSPLPASKLKLPISLFFSDRHLSPQLAFRPPTIHTALTL